MVGRSSSFAMEAAENNSRWFLPEASLFYGIPATIVFLASLLGHSADGPTPVNGQSVTSDERSGI